MIQVSGNRDGVVQTAGNCRVRYGLAAENTYRPRFIRGTQQSAGSVAFCRLPHSILLDLGRLQVMARSSVMLRFPRRREVVALRRVPKPRLPHRHNSLILRERQLESMPGQKLFLSFSVFEASYQCGKGER